MHLYPWFSLLPHTRLIYSRIIRTRKAYASYIFTHLPTYLSTSNSMPMLMPMPMPTFLTPCLRHYFPYAYIHEYLCSIIPSCYILLPTYYIIRLAHTELTTPYESYDLDTNAWRPDTRLTPLRGTTCIIISSMSFIIRITYPPNKGAPSPCTMCGAWPPFI